MSNPAAETQPPWKKIEALLFPDDSAQVVDFLESLPPVEVARSISNLDVSNQVRLMELLGPEKSASILAKISGLGVSTIIGHLATEQAAAIVEEMPHLQISFISAFFY